MWFVLDVSVRLVVGGLLVSAGGAKLSSSPVWRELWVASYRLLPGPVVSPVARGLPFVEVATGLALLTGASGGAVAATALLGLISLAVLSALARGLRLSCGCFGRLDKLLSGPIAIRNLVLTACCGAIAVRGHEAPALAGQPWLGQVAALGAVVAATLGSLLHNRRRAQQRHLERLVLASGRTTRPRAAGLTETKRTPTEWADQPATIGGTQ